MVHDAPFNYPFYIPSKGNNTFAKTETGRKISLSEKEKTHLSSSL
jgi:hypothetical protein